MGPYALEIIAGSRQTVQNLEDAFAWLLAQGEVDKAQMVLGVLLGLSMERDELLQSMVAAAQEALAAAPSVRPGA